MRILYLDESGTANGWNTQKNFVLGGLAVHEGQIYSLANELDKIQKKYWPDISFPIEFHASQILSGKGKRFRKMTLDTRIELCTDVYEVIGNIVFPNAFAYATSIDETCVQNARQVTRTCFEDVCQNYNKYLYDQYLKNHPAKGLLVIDRGREKEYLQIFGEFKKSTDHKVYLANIVDIPYFTACQETRMLQIADFISHSVWRYYEYGEEDTMNKIINTFYRRDHDYPPFGLNHITSDDTCDCHACHYKNK